MGCRVRSPSPPALAPDSCASHACLPRSEYRLHICCASGMLKDGAKHLSGLEETVLKNIEACKQLSKMTRTSLGPNGMNKMVINHLDKLFVTSDAATIVKELEVAHPAARLLVMAAQAQEQEIGDGTNLVRSASERPGGSQPCTGPPPCAHWQNRL